MRHEGFPDIRSGMPVVGSNGAQVGHVQESRTDELLVNRPTRGDLRIPRDAVAFVDNEERVVLRVPAEQVDDMDWPLPR